MKILRSSEVIRLKTVGVEDSVAPIIEEIAVKFVTARFQGDVDHAAAETSVGRVIGVGHDLELTHRLGVGRNLPGPPLVADRRAVQEKEILSGPRAVDSERVVYVPAAPAPKSARAYPLPS